MNADRRVASARSERNQQHSGPAGELAVGLGHKRGPAFLAASDEADFRRVEQRVEHFEITLAGDAEGHVDTMGAQRSDHQLSAAKKVRCHRPTSSLRCNDGHLSRCNAFTEGICWAGMSRLAVAYNPLPADGSR